MSYTSLIKKIYIRPHRNVKQFFAFFLPTRYVDTNERRRPAARQCLANL
ncbi:hypothetical protein DSUL_170014 [Desulfovibrionales bacterium]